MKKIILVPGLLIILLAGCGDGRVSEEFDPDAPSAKINEITGEVTWQQREASDWSAAAVNQHLRPGEKVRTGTESAARLQYVDASRVTMAPETELVVKAIETVTEEQGMLDIIVRVVRGLTMFEVEDDGGTREFMVESPGAITCVRGTIFSVGVEGDGASRIVVKQGKVAVTGAGTTVTLGASQATRVVPGRTPSTPEVVNLIEEEIFNSDLRELPTLRRGRE